MPNQHRSFQRICSADRKGLTALVVELCKKHLRLFPDYGPAWLRYGIANVELARYDDAEKAICRAISACPKEKLRIPFAQMGHLFEAKGEFKKAVFWYRRASRLDPENADYHIFLGSVASKQGRLSRAEFHFRRAIKCPDGCMDEAYFNLGGIMLGKGHYDQAVDCYRRALKIDPDYAKAKKRLKDAELALRMRNC